MRFKISVLPFVVAACSSAVDVQDGGQNSALLGQPLFIAQTADAGFVMEALFVGRVVLDQNGCIRLDNAGRATVIWPKGFSLAGSDVLDAEGRVIGTLGRNFKFGGGEVPSADYIPNLRDETRAAAIARCGGLYWVVGDVPQR